ncbi:MAG: hypothetical protein AAF720_12770 [Pseudomonadota bacterium]
MTAPKGFARSSIEAARILDSDDPVVLHLDLAKERVRTREEAEAFFAGPLEGRWGELAVDLSDYWRCWVSYYGRAHEPKVPSSLTQEDRTYIEKRLNAAPAPKRNRPQKGLDFGLFEVSDPDRPGWTYVSDE